MNFKSICGTEFLWLILDEALWCLYLLSYDKAFTLPTNYEKKNVNLISIYCVSRRLKKWEIASSCYYTKLCNYKSKKCLVFSRFSSMLIQ